MRKLSLEDIWDYTKRMWKWIAFQKEVLKDERHVIELKKVWLQENALEFVAVKESCFFCDARAHEGSCSTACPASLVEGPFDCQCEEHHYADKPGAFYREILRLDAIRTAEPVVVELVVVEPTFKMGDVFWRDETVGRDYHYIQLILGEDGCVGLRNTHSSTIVYDLKSVQNINAITMAEVQSMTAYPEGLRYVENFIVTEID